ncbi:MAG: penicillin acylase family protein [Acidobacteriaceae bacterium]|nr:penicillin acylase family protein [Acidobacteriaceae bacterium]
MTSRFLRAINLSIAAVALLLGVAVYWYAIRPLPKTSGEISAPIGGPATIQRDARGIPHITASSWQDALFLQGFVAAQDRLWQMDGLRRFGAGELADVFGPNALSADEQARRMRMRATADADVQHLRPEERAQLVAYAKGVNFFIDTHRGDYQLEFSLPGHSYDPRPWTISDSILVGLVMFRDLTDSSHYEMVKGSLFAEGADPAKIYTLFPASAGAYVNPGSNAWAVSGAHAADGAPMAANDPHLAYAIPGTWHLVHLKAPGLDVSGASLPGVPGVISGHNSQIAWGVTNLQADVMDMYAEQIDTRTGRYLYGNQLQQATLDTELIAVKGAKPVPLGIWITRHGPVVEYVHGRGYSLRWSAYDGFGNPFFDIDRAQNFQQFRDALKHFWGPGQNFIYADKAGNIGYQATGAVPIRHGFHGDVPLDGTSPKFEWDGYIPFEQLPSVFNPASGIVATANQKTFPADYPYTVDGSFADPYRIRQIQARLTAKPKLTVDDMLAIQKDVYSAYDHFLARQVVEAFRRCGSKDALVRQAAAILEHWNGQMDKGEAGPMITELLHEELALALTSTLMQPAINNAVQRSTGPQLQNSAARTDRRDHQYRLVGALAGIPDIRPRPLVIQTLLENRPAGWVSGNNWDMWIIDHLAAAVKIGREQQGTPISRWKWGRLLRWKVEHPVGKQLPFVSGFFDIGPVDMSGSGTTVKQTTGTLGPSERMVVDFGDFDKSVQNLPEGESGHVASPHYKDQWPAYYVGKSFPMEFNHVEAQQTLQVKPAS